ncbi:MAG: helix-turn-helix domain-containing protein [Gammaproteobacteria bacterium]|nr:helix-turn-helix domain-containing protein [Gammaproteobacteria bacterium]
MKDALAVNLRRVRTDQGLSVLELARKAGVTRQTLIALEAGTANPTLETLMSIAEALGVQSAVLLTAGSPPSRLVRSSEDGVLRENYGVVRILDQMSEIAVLGILEAQIYAGRDFPRAARGDQPGTFTFIYVLSGRILIGPVANPVELGAGDYFRLRLDEPYVLRALDGEARFFSGLCSTRPDGLNAVLGRRRRPRKTSAARSGRRR